MDIKIYNASDITRNFITNLKWLLYARQIINCSLDETFEIAKKWSRSLFSAPRIYE